MLTIEDLEANYEKHYFTFGCTSDGHEGNFDDNKLQKQAAAESTSSAERGETFDREEKQHDTSVTWYQCQHCRYKCRNKHTLTMHQEKKHYYCEDILTKLMGDEHVEKTRVWLQCDFCEFKSTSSWCLECHKKHNHGVVDDWLEHESKAEQEPNLTQNSDKCKESNDECHLIKCEIGQEIDLTKDFSENDTQEAQCIERDEHETVEQYQCPLCDFKTQVKMNYSNHWKIQHEQPVWYQCDVCEFESTSLWGLDCHKKHNHSVVDDWLEDELKVEQKPKCEREEKTDVTRDFSEYDTQEGKCTNCVISNIKKEEFVFKIEQKSNLMLKIDECDSVTDEFCQIEYKAEELTNVTNVF